MCGVCIESDLAGGRGSAAFRRSFVIRVASSAERLDRAGGIDASSASGLAGCVRGRAGKGVVAHPANKATTAKDGKILERIMNSQYLGAVKFPLRAQKCPHRHPLDVLSARTKISVARAPLQDRRPLAGRHDTGAKAR
jgi:hypothetical protein